MIDVSIIIVNYNTPILTQQCINSIFKYTSGISFEVILIDNASSDESRIIFSNDSRIIYQYETINHGFGKANNIASQRARGKYLFFLNSDTVLLNNAVLELYSYYENHVQDNIGVIGGYLLDNDRNQIHSGGAFPFFKTVIKPILGLGSSHHIDYVTGADMFLPVTLYKEVGMFDEDFFMYYEETYMQYLISKLSYKNILVKGPRIIHLEGQSQHKHSNKKRIQINRSLFIFWRKIYSPYRVVLYKLVFIFIKFGVFFRRNYSFGENVKFIASLIKN